MGFKEKNCTTHFPLGGEPSSLGAGSAVAAGVSGWFLVEVLVFLHHSSTGSSVGPCGCVWFWLLVQTAPLVTLPHFLVHLCSACQIYTKFLISIFPFRSRISFSRDTWPRTAAHLKKDKYKKICNS